MPVAVVTGGAGFIGSHLVDLLIARGYIVRVIDNFSVGRAKNLVQHDSEVRLEIVERDIINLSREDTEFVGVDVVFHFAGIGDIVPSIQNPSKYFETNAQGTIEVLEAARRHGVGNFVYAASSSCYGLADTPTSETAPIDLQYPYAISKYFGEQAALKWGTLYGLKVNSIRIFNAYGLRSKTTGAYGAVMGVFLKQKLKGKPLTLVGDGSQTRDFVNVKDLVKAFFMVSESNISNEIFNVGAGKPVSILELVRILDEPFINIPWRPGEPDCTWADISKIQQVVGWSPEIEFKRGVEEMLEHIEYWRDAPLWDEESIKSATADWFKFLGHK